MTISVVFRHLGPGPHPGGSPQSVHGHPGAKFVPMISSEANVSYKYSSPYVVEMMMADKVRSQEFGQWWQDNCEDWKGDPNDNGETLNQYAGIFYYRAINQWLRAKDQAEKDVLAMELDASKLDKMVADMDQAVNHPLSRDFILYRGIRGEEELESLKPGTEFVDKGFTSCTLRRRATLGFASRSDLWTVAEVFVPKGTKTATTWSPNMASDEQEVVLSRGTKFKVVSVDRDENWKDPFGNKSAIQYVRLEVVS